MTDKFIVNVGHEVWGSWGSWPHYFKNFYYHCLEKAECNDWKVDTVMNYELKPHGKLIKTKTQGWYLRWDDELQHTMFVLRWA